MAVNAETLVQGYSSIAQLERSGVRFDATAERIAAHIIRDGSLKMPTFRGRLRKLGTQSERHAVFMDPKTTLDVETVLIAAVGEDVFLGNLSRLERTCQRLAAVELSSRNKLKEPAALVDFVNGTGRLQAWFEELRRDFPGRT